MITRETQITICDNSGASLVRCIGFKSSIKKKFVGINNLVSISIKKLNRRKFYTPKGKARSKISRKSYLNFKKEKLKYRAFIISTKKTWSRKDGSFVKSSTNRAVLIDWDKFKLLGTRIRGPISKELRRKKKQTLYKEIVSIAKRRF